MLFYNDEGTENGGLVFSGHRNAKGEVMSSGGMLTFDRYAGSQIVQLAGVHDSTDHIVGLIVSDTDDRRRRRVFVGHDKEGVARIGLMDGTGRPRILLQVTSDGVPSLSFLDSNGKVVNQIGPTGLKRLPSRRARPVQRSIPAGGGGPSWIGPIPEGGWVARDTSMAGCLPHFRADLNAPRR
jgi:hypothetical protein